MNLHKDKPTIFSFEDLYTWVIWQFPMHKDNCLYGAARPPVAEHGWYAALIDTDSEQIQLYGHISQLFDTPEAAMAYLRNGANPEEEKK